VIPHVTDAIQDWLERVAGMAKELDGEDADVCIIEVSKGLGKRGSETD
jgi:CTP synthase (UTP-ammonia lyase)